MSTIRQRTAKELNKANNVNYHKRDWGRAMEDLKADHLRASNNHNHKIWENGNVTDKDSGEYLGNLLEYLP